MPPPALRRSTRSALRRGTPTALKVVAPYSAADARGLLKAAIRDDNPVVFLENEILYGMAFDITEGARQRRALGERVGRGVGCSGGVREGWGTGARVGDCRPRLEALFECLSSWRYKLGLLRLHFGRVTADVKGVDFTVPIGECKIEREGTDVTLVSYSRGVHTCLEAAAALAEMGVSCEVPKPSSPRRRGCLEARVGLPVVGLQQLSAVFPTAASCVCAHARGAARHSG